MLVCPQCQFENPDANRFCQKCGTSLTDVTCSGCGAIVPTDVEHCPQCHTVTGLIWRAFVIPTTEQETVAPQGMMGSAIEALEGGDRPSTPPIYLDAQQRYQILDPLPMGPLPVDGVAVRVLDCQPYQPSLLDVVNQQRLGEDGSEENLAEEDTGMVETAIPALAHIYLDLQAQFDMSLPQIHDAWEAEGCLILLLENRTQLPAVTDQWGKEQVLPLQRLHWLYQMTDLWDVLELYGCRRSLLNPDNLRVDEDYLLCLQRLYPDHPDRPPALKELGLIWQQWIDSTSEPPPASLQTLIQAITAGEMEDIVQVQSQFEAIANGLQPEEPPPPAAIPTTAPSSISDLTSDPTLSFMDTEDYPVSGAILADDELDDEYATEGEDAPTVVLPMKLINLEDAGRTDVGRQRDHNEDCYIIQSGITKLEGPAGRTLHVRGLYILCDGMGGHAGGEVASALAAETLKQFFETRWTEQLPLEADLREAIYLANKAIHDLNQQNASSGSGRMGTTLVMVLIQDTQVAIAHVGDSRLYRFSRRRGLEQITSDHEVGQREIQRGVEPAIAYARPDAYQLTQALGPRDENFISPDVQFLELNEDLLLLLCSDGLSDNDLLESHWSTHVEPLLANQTNLEQGVNQLVELANQYNGHDNITAIAIRARVRPNLELLKYPGR